MDADRFDALSRALTRPGSRRATLKALFGGLLGGVLPGLSPESLAAAGKRKGTTKHGDARRKHDHPRHGAGAKIRHSLVRQDRHRLHTQDVMDDQTVQRDAAAQPESGGVSANDVRAAACLPPGAKPCRQHTECCSGRCKRKKKKCLPCAKGTEYCDSNHMCVAPGQCVASCATGTADCNGDGICETDTTSSTQHCGGCNKPCGTNQTCVNSICTGGKTCSPDPCPGDKVCNSSTGFCTCPAGKQECFGRPALCSDDPNTDSTRCGINCLDCAVSNAPGFHCCNGQCVNGCGPASNSGCDGPCGSSCTPCSGGQFCCNLGPGTTSQCVDPVGGLCPSLATP
jgi:hypothetical protein